MKLPELLAPAGNPDKLRFAILYGADSVYVGGKDFSLRSRADNFTLDEMQEGAAFAHAHGKKIYLALNIFPRNSDLEKIRTLLPLLHDTGMDAVIVSDPGTFTMVRETLPSMPIHISTQANLLNTATVKFWEKMGAKRVVLARELSLQEIREIRQSATLELETFVHGAMCMSYSGRCLLSQVMTGRSANLGDCAQPCRWEYTLCEGKRPGESFPIDEVQGHSFIMNSKDLNLIRHLPELLSAGVDSLKIEGRMKSLYYTAAVTRVYRDALDSYARDPDGFCFNETWWEELTKVSHRDYTSGFLSGKGLSSGQNTEISRYIQHYDFTGIVTDVQDKDITVQARNKMSLGDRIEWIGPGMASFVSEIRELSDPGGQPLSCVQPEQVFLTSCDHPVGVHFLLRRKKTIGDAL